MDDGGQCGSAAATSGGGGQAGSTPGNAAERVQAASRPGVDGGSAMPPFASGQGRARVVAPSLSGLAVGTPMMAGSMPGDAVEHVQAGSGAGADGGSALPIFALGQGRARAEAPSACRMAGSTSGLAGSTPGLAAGVQCLSDEDNIDAQAHGIAMSDAGSNLSFNGGTTSETHYRVNLRGPSYIVYLEDDNTDEVDAKEHVVEKFDSSKIVPFVVEFITNPTYKSNITLEKLEKLPVRRNPNISLEASSSEGSDDDSVEIEEKVDPSWMDDEDIFLDDHEVFVSLGLRAEEEAARMNLGEDCFGLGGHHATILVNDEADNEPRFAIDKENPNIRKGETFPSMVDFRQALKHDAILNEFQVHKVVTDKKRYRAECKANGCPWRIVANKLVGQPTIEVTMISFEHECMGTNNLVSTMASSKWVSDRVIAWLRKKPSLGTVDLQDRLLEKYGIEVGYNTVWAGRKLAMDSIYGAWEDNFQYLFRFRKKKAYAKRKAKSPKIITTETISPGSITRRIVEMVHEEGEVGTSSSSISAKRLLVLDQEVGDDASK
ncbi:hypothetical protein PR202_ga21474 [Eleusine coracana subsp. coracana]|uniref:Transposase MuDR plant domain-containing protein n=1 Tax=Eleusine coracana subsp. coracana TaxID=191504 RepID=A0AAV5D0N2_ELECO|nr:hypothetical protein PR202_ga21474 [Eleusine coracana subsp. coracana]